MSEHVDVLAPRQEEAEADVHFEPVVKLTEQVEVKTHEEDEDVVFKMRAKLFRFEGSTTEWKERGTGEVRLLAHREKQKVRLVMRRDKTHKVCANHAITQEMQLKRNIGSDRSWVWTVAADYAEMSPTSETLAIQLANSDNAAEFKAAFEAAQATNARLAATAATGLGEGVKETKEETKAEERSAPEPTAPSTDASKESGAKAEGN